MIKLLTIGFLLFLLYRFVVHPKKLAERRQEELQEKGTEEYTDYEEVE